MPRGVLAQTITLCQALLQPHVLQEGKLQGIIGQLGKADDYTRREIIQQIYKNTGKNFKVTKILLTPTSFGITSPGIIPRISDHHLLVKSPNQ